MLRPEPEPRERWTPGRGLARAALAGSGVAAALAVLLGLVAAGAPTILYHLVLRTAIAFGVCWLLLRTVEHFGGAGGWPFTTIAVVLSMLVMLSNFAASALAAGGMNAAQPSPTALGTFLALNLMTIVGIALAVRQSAD